MNKSKLAMLLGFVVALAGIARAEVSAESDKGRFSMTPVDGGLMRLDAETGAVALCTKKTDTWVCEPVADRSEGSADRAKLEVENQALKARIKDLEASTSANKMPPGVDDPTGAPGGVTKLPTEEEVDKAMDYVERIYKKFRDRLQKLEQSPSLPAPKSSEDGKSAL